MLRGRIFRTRDQTISGDKHEANSISTQESRSPLNTPKTYFNAKEKSQLCRKFMQQGFCPYQKKCKFAHGSHQLKRNNMMNSKYKTKQCETFFYAGFCKFGERCNFIHKHKQTQKMQSWKKIKSQYRDLLSEAATSSRMGFS